MAGVYTEETLQSLNKTQLIKLFLKTQEQTNNAIKTLTEEIKEIDCSIKKLESEIIVVKKVNDAKLITLINACINLCIARFYCIQVNILL